MLPSASSGGKVIADVWLLIVFCPFCETLYHYMEMLVIIIRYQPRYQDHELFFDHSTNSEGIITPIRSRVRSHSLFPTGPWWSCKNSWYKKKKRQQNQSCSHRVPLEYLLIASRNKGIIYGQNIRKCIFLSFILLQYLRPVFPYNECLPYLKMAVFLHTLMNIYNFYYDLIEWLAWDCS